MTTEFRKLYKPSLAHKVAHFACGALLGGLAGGLAVLYYQLMPLQQVIAAVAGPALACGALAFRYCDNFWDTLKDLWTLGPF